MALTELFFEQFFLEIGRAFVLLAKLDVVFEPLAVDDELVVQIIVGVFGNGDKDFAGLIQIGLLPSFVS